MPSPARRRVDFTRLPAPARYCLALAVLAVIVGIVSLTPGFDASAGSAGWYIAVVRIGAVLLLLFAVSWLVRRVLRARRRR